jgi:Zinc finger, C3HC4 type (RING finger)
MIRKHQGNVNLRTCFADINKEAMFPIHCAVMGGCLELVKWLVDEQLVPIVGPAVNVRQQSQPLLQSVQTSASRTLLDLAMTGRPKVEILMYLIAEKGLRINDVKDPQLAPKTLETLMKSSSGLMLIPPSVGTNNDGTGPHVVMDNVAGQEDSVMSNADSMDDACNICFERQMDCVLIPCGHQVCCIECAQQVRSCPICKVECSALRVFRQ